MENTIVVKKEEKKPSSVENFGKTSLQIGDKLGKAVTEWFLGKQLTKEEKELNEIRKERRLQLKLMQEDAQFEKDMELAKRGEYVPPEPKVKAKKKEDNNIFANLGKHNPLQDFNKSNSFGSSNNFGVEGYGNNTKNPLGKKERY